MPDSTVVDEVIMPVRRRTISQKFFRTASTGVTFMLSVSARTGNKFVAIGNVVTDYGD